LIRRERYWKLPWRCRLIDSIFIDKPIATLLAGDICEQTTWRTRTSTATGSRAENKQKMCLLLQQAEDGESSSIPPSPIEISSQSWTPVFDQDMSCGTRSPRLSDSMLARASIVCSLPPYRVGYSTVARQLILSWLANHWPGSPPVSHYRSQRQGEPSSNL